MTAGGWHNHTICSPNVFFSIDYHSDKINGCHIDCRENVDALLLCFFISWYFALFSFYSQSIVIVFWRSLCWWNKALYRTVGSIAYWGQFVARDAFSVKCHWSIEAFFRSLRFKEAQKHFFSQPLLSATHLWGFIELQPIISTSHVQFTDEFLTL